MHPRRRAAFRDALLAWYRGHRRAMPWRAAPGERADAYHVLVSEAMLQQTQVATVVDYFHRFIAAFPTVEALAAAHEDAVLRVWQGLGYYRRARHLHAAAKAVVARHGGAIPADATALLALPGVGRYTAGAVASIAFGLPEPIVDGNVARVLARLAVIDEPIDRGPTQRRLWALADELLPAGRSKHDPGDFNQAMMELGATVCTPRSPGCGVCPVGRFCEAKAAGRVDVLPVVSPRRKPRAVTHHVLAVRRGARWLFERRGDAGLWAGMWQMPTFEDADADVATRLGVRIDSPTAVGRFEHMTTHRRIAFEVLAADAAGGRLRAGAGVWRKLDDLDDLPLANPQRRAVEMLRRWADRGD